MTLKLNTSSMTTNLFLRLRGLTYYLPVLFKKAKPNKDRGLVQALKIIYSSGLAMLLKSNAIDKAAINI